MNQPTFTPVKLRGHLGGKFGSMTRRLDVRSPREAIEALCCTVPGFRDALRATRVKILVRNEPITLEEFSQPSGRGEIRIVPVPRGSKDVGVQMLEGAALIAFSVFVPGPWSPTMMSIGVALELGGVAQLLNGAPSAPAATNSYLFSNAQNTIAQGIPVPVFYGQMTIVPPLISEGIDTEAFVTTLFNLNYDGLGTWTGNGDDIPWGASLACK
ncbi:MAG: hypothetical protein ABSH53_02960 [Holophaga sp.]|jgi:predicted phage tail protein